MVIPFLQARTPLCFACLRNKAVAILQKNKIHDKRCSDFSESRNEVVSYIAKLQSKYRRASYQCYTKRSEKADLQQ